APGRALDGAAPPPRPRPRPHRAGGRALAPTVARRRGGLGRRRGAVERAEHLLGREPLLLAALDPASLPGRLEHAAIEGNGVMVVAAGAPGGPPPARERARGAPPRGRRGAEARGPRQEAGPPGRAGARDRRRRGAARRAPGGAGPSPDGRASNARGRPRSR